MPGPLLRMTGIDKGFPGVRALAGVDFEVEAGEVQALLGENGAGKSTLLKILAGAQAPDAGEIRFDGRPVSFAGPGDAQGLGIVTIYQEFNLVPSMSVAENLFIGREPGRYGFVDWRRVERETGRVLQGIGLDVAPGRAVADLSIAEQQMVEIARALSMRSRLIVMDEPTSALSEHEVERLFAIVRDLRAQGIAIVFVTHRLNEVMRLCDRFTVLRDGERVGAGRIDAIDVEGLIRLMVGRDVERLYRHREGADFGAEALRVEGLSRLRDPTNPHATMVHDASLHVRKGEILGIAGLVGAGRTELARGIFGADPIASGRITVDGTPIIVRSPKDAIRAGIGLVPEDRKLQALFLALAVGSNLSIVALDRLTRAFGVVDSAAERDLVDDYRDRLGIKMAGPAQAIANLSGGNQQKVVLARWLALRPSVLIVDEPTRGIDVAAKADVHGLLFDLALSGIAVIVVSSELPEILSLSDRIVTMREGRITGEVTAAEASEARLMNLMTLGAGEAA